MLPGFPPDGAVPAAWRPFGPSGPAGTVTLSGASLQRIEGTLCRLEREHFRGLAEIVADADEWLRRARFLLGEWKRAVHAGAPLCVDRWLDAGVLPARLCAAVRAFRSGLAASRDLFDSLLFMQLSGPAVPGADLLDWFGVHHDHLEKVVSAGPGMKPSVVLDAARMLFLIHAEVPVALQSAIFDVVTEPASWRVQHEHHSHRSALFKTIGRIGKALPSRSPPAESPLVAAVLGLPTRLLMLAPDRRAAVATLLAAVTPAGLAATARVAASHQRRSAAILRDRIRDVEQARPGIRGVVTTDAREKCAALVARTPEESAIAGLLSSIESLLHWSASAEQIDAMHRLLRWFPADQSGVRPGLLRRWIKVFVTDRQFVGNASRVCRLFSQRGVHPSIVAAVADGRQAGMRADPISELVGCSDAGTSGAVLTLFERLIYEAGWQPTVALVSGLADLVAGLGRVDLAEAVARRLGPEWIETCDDETLASVARLTTSTEEVVSLVQLTDDPDSFSALDTLAKHLSDPEDRALAIRTGVRGDGHLLRQWALAIRMTMAAGADRPSRRALPADATRCPPWAAHYPPELRGAISRLAAATDDAERIAAAAGARLFADPAALRAEVAAIDGLLADCPAEESRARLSARRTRLLARAEGREAPHPSTVAKVLAALERRGDEVVIRSSIREARNQLRSRLLQLSGGDRIDDAVFEPPLVDLLAGLLSLSGEVRAVGLRLLLDRAVGRVFDPLAEPANRRYVEQIRAKGIDLRPWLDDRIATRGTTATGAEFVVRFSDDVLDTMLMGHHFHTCLSPDRMNFFSVVANAADVNKRVAYGRTREGRIVGRRLVALTDDGLVMPFRPYSHEGDAGFNEAADAFARELAEVMGTFLTVRGAVSPLVLTRWYDDGASDVAGARSIEAADGLVARALGDADPQRVVGEVSDLLGGRDRLRDSLQRVLDLPALRSRPELLPAFADAFGADNEASAAVRLRIAMACRRAGDDARAGGLLESIPAAAVVTTLGKDFCLRCCAFHGVEESLEAVLSWLVARRPALVSRLIGGLARRVRRDVTLPTERRTAISTLARYRAAAWRVAGR